MAKQNALKQEAHNIKSRPEARTGDRLGSARDDSNADDRRVAPEEFDRLIHERIRLAIVSALAADETLTFNDLKELLKTTDGNLSVHARKLEEAGYVTCTKSFEGRLPKTEYQLTTTGRRALEHYLDHMEALIRAARRR